MNLSRIDSVPLIPLISGSAGISCTHVPGLSGWLRQTLQSPDDFGTTGDASSLSTIPSLRKLPISSVIFRSGKLIASSNQHPSTLAARCAKSCRDTGPMSATTRDYENECAGNK